jgi:hypothetical protein
VIYKENYNFVGQWIEHHGRETVVIAKENYI